jgi:hypothetical protein
MTSKLAAGFEIALGVHISPDKIDIVIETAKLWAGPVICAIFAVRSDAIVDRFKSLAPNVDPVFVPPSSDSDHVYVTSRMRAPELIFRHHSSIISSASPSVFCLHFCQIPRESSASSCNGPLPRYFCFQTMFDGVHFRVSRRHKCVFAVLIISMQGIGSSSPSMSTLCLHQLYTIR